MTKYQVGIFTELPMGLQWPPDNRDFNSRDFHLWASHQNCPDYPAATLKNKFFYPENY